MFDLSIIIVNYKTRNLLEQCLNSIYSENYHFSYEVSVVDNNSKDSSIEMVKKKFPQVKLIENRNNSGFAAANNQALRRSNARYLLLINPDTVVLPDSLNVIMEFMDEHPEAGIAGCKLLNPDYSLQYSCRKFSNFATFFLRGIHLDSIFPNNTILRKYMMFDWDHNEVREVDWVLGSCMMVRRKAIEQVGRLDENFILYFEDQDWCYRMWKHGWKVYYVPQAQMIHYYQRRSAKQFLNVSTWTHIKSMLYFFKKHYLQFPLSVHGKRGGVSARRKEGTL